jgi:hypothetical protein
LFTGKKGTERSEGYERGKTRDDVSTKLRGGYMFRRFLNLSMQIGNELSRGDG